MTWFRKDKEFKWFEPGELNKLIDFIGKSESQEDRKTERRQ